MFREIMDGILGIAAPTGVRRWSAPFPDNILVMFDLDFVQRMTHWKPLPLDTKDRDSPSFVLVSESAIQRTGGGMGRWTRTYATVPPSRNDFESYVMTYPGMIGSTVSFGSGPAITIDAGRKAFSTRVTARLQYDYFHVGFSPGIKTPQDIPIIEGFEVLIAGPIRGFEADLLGANTAPTAQQYADMTRQATVLPPPSPFSPAVFPVVSGSREIAAEDSTLSRWMGNIWQRTTRYVPVL